MVDVYRDILDVRIKGVLIEQDSTTSIMGHKETIRTVLVTKVYKCLL